MVLTLQGKLCGAFAAARLLEEGEVAEPFDVVPAAEAHGMVAAAPAPVHSAAPAVETPAPVLGDPKHLHTVWQTRLAAGDAGGALEVAREAIPAGLAKREPRLAAEIYRRHLDRLPELGLDRTALDLLADQLLRDGDVAAAAWTFSQALDTEPTDPKAFKGLLRVAEHHLDKAKEPLEAIRVYRYLLERAPASPFADHARDLLGAAERRAARPSGPPG
jgi:TolA-binding protein